ncbi:hypothetical protein [Flavobacterium sp. IMCC34518]|nr:hypothetical protein [Flavobacterium sp. IMCC34518]
MKVKLQKIKWPNIEIQQYNFNHTSHILEFKAQKKTQYPVFQ